MKTELEIRAVLQQLNQLKPKNQHEKHNKALIRGTLLWVLGQSEIPVLMKADN